MADAGSGATGRTKSLGRLARSVAIITHRPVMGSLRSSGNYGDSSSMASSGQHHQIISWWKEGRLELERCASTQIRGGAEIRAELMPRATCVVEWDGKPGENAPTNGVGPEGSPPWQAASVPPGDGTTQTSIGRKFATALDVEALCQTPRGGLAAIGRSEERRVGKECRSRWSPD